MFKSSVVQVFSHIMVVTSIRFLAFPSPSNLLVNWKNIYSMKWKQFDQTSAVRLKVVFCYSGSQKISCQIEIYAWYIWHQQSTLSLTEKNYFCQEGFECSEIAKRRFDKRQRWRKTCSVCPGRILTKKCSVHKCQQRNIGPQICRYKCCDFISSFLRLGLRPLDPSARRARLTYLMSPWCAVVVQKVVTYLLVISLSDVQIAPVLKAICC